MSTPKKARKEPTVVFSLRCPVSMEAEVFRIARRMKLERNGFIVAAIAEKLEREKEARGVQQSAA